MVKYLNMLHQHKCRCKVWAPPMHAQTYGYAHTQLCFAPKQMQTYTYTYTYTFTDTQMHTHGHMYRYMSGMA